MQVQGGLWNPDIEPWGVGRRITVKDLNELKEFSVKDVSNGVIEQEQGIIVANERVSGLSDTAAVGTQARQSNTLGQDQMISRASAVRVDEIVGYLHLAIADVFKLSHAIWVETLEADSKGLEPPDRVISGLQQRGQELPNGRFTAEQLKANVHFKPYGSDATSDPNQRQAQFTNKFVSLGNLGTSFPALQPVFMHPDVVQALLEEWMRTYDVRDRQPYLTALAAIKQQQAALAGMPPAGADPLAGGAPAPAGDPLAAVMQMIQGGGALPPGPTGGAPDGY
jgi:hypothetical protein